MEWIPNRETEKTETEQEHPSNRCSFNDNPFLFPTGNCSSKAQLSRDLTGRGWWRGELGTREHTAQRTSGISSEFPPPDDMTGTSTLVMLLGNNQYLWSWQYMPHWMHPHALNLMALLWKQRKSTWSPLPTVCLVKDEVFPQITRAPYLTKFTLRDGEAGFGIVQKSIQWVSQSPGVLHRLQILNPLHHVTFAHIPTNVMGKVLSY